MPLNQQKIFFSFQEYDFYHWRVIMRQPKYRTIIASLKCRCLETTQAHSLVQWHSLAYYSLKHKIKIAPHKRINCYMVWTFKVIFKTMRPKFIKAKDEQKPVYLSVILRQVFLAKSKGFHCYPARSQLSMIGRLINQWNWKGAVTPRQLFWNPHNRVPSHPWAKKT